MSTIGIIITYESCNAWNLFSRKNIFPTAATKMQRLLRRAIITVQLLRTQFKSMDNRFY